MKKTSTTTANKRVATKKASTPQTSAVTQMSNLQLAISIVKSTRDKGSIDALQEVSTEIGQLSTRLGVEFNEAFLIAAMMEWNQSMTVFGLRNYLDCSRLEAELFGNVFEDLLKKDIVSKEGYDDDSFIYKLSPAIIAAIRNNKPYVKEKRRKLSTEAFWKAVGDIFLHSEFHIFSAIYELDTLLSRNKTSCLAKLFSEHSLNDKSRLLLAWACWRRYVAQEEQLTLDVLTRYDNLGELHSLFRSTVSMKSELSKKKYMEAVCEDGMVTKDAIRLTDSCVRRVLGSEFEKTKKDIFVEGLISHRNIPAKDLFYNVEENEIVQKILRTMNEKNFQEIQKRMKEASFRVSYPVLLYGDPGVGKTELCFQLARLTGRDIIEVKVSELRDKYVGEAEKHAQEIFDKYRMILKNSAKAPILLLNEADSMLTKRSLDNDSPAAKGENAMQNIFLREFEKFEGILLATTNLQGNFDPAFERRFLLKLKLTQPGEKVRAQIWKSLVKGLSDMDAQRLAKEFVMSGGQIENCARRQMIEWFLDGKGSTYNTLATLAHEELGFKKTAHKTVGFNVA